MIADDPDPAGSNARTLAAYESRAEAYREQTSAPLGPAILTLLAALDRLAPPGSVLEIGSAHGRDALALERLGRRVRRTDAARAFVDMLRGEGHEASLINVLTDALVDAEHGPYAAVLADAVFLHFTPEQLRIALARLRRALLPGGVLAFTVKRGEGAEWSRDKLGLPRYFQYWQPDSLRFLLADAEWEVLELAVAEGEPRSWIAVITTPTPRTRHEQWGAG